METQNECHLSILGIKRKVLKSKEEENSSKEKNKKKAKKSCPDSIAASIGDCGL